MRKTFSHTYHDIISLENLLCAWQEFVKGKRKRRDVQEFTLLLMDNILLLHRDLKTKTYTHSLYEAFNISDPKPRNIHKASVRDRLLHHAIYRKLYPFFDTTFTTHSYSCRKGKGTHRAFNTFRSFAYKVSKNNTRTCWVLKCDIKKFFASINHHILIDILKKYIHDKDIIWLLSQIIESFHTAKDTGLPLGNLTSQLLVNIYMNEFDRFVKHTLKTKHYIRYADDFVFLSHDKNLLASLILYIQSFLSNQLKLALHPHKVSIETLASGVDFLGWIHFPDHRVLRTTTKRRLLKHIKHKPRNAHMIQSYFGLLSHGNAHKVEQEVYEYIDTSSLL